MEKSKKDKKDKKKYSGFPGDCSEEHLSALEKFKPFVKSQSEGQMNPQWDDIYLLRFLRARKFNLKETQKMWMQFITWRKKNDIDNAKQFYFPQLQELRKMYPHGNHKYDKQYRPIYIERVGMVNIDHVKKIITEETMLQYYSMGYEYLLTSIMESCSKQKMLETGDGTKVTQSCNIVDLKGFKLSNASKAHGFVKPASEMAQNYYPEILGDMFIINAPMLFTGVWAIVKMWIDEKTRQKIHILGSSYKKQLLKYVDPENLPDFIDGGTCKCKGGDCLSPNIGPWNPEGHEIYPQCLEKPKEKEVKKEEEEEPETLEVKKQAEEDENDEKEQVKKELDKVNINQSTQVLDQPKPESKSEQKVQESNDKSQ